MSLPKLWFLTAACGALLLLPVPMPAQESPGQEQQQEEEPRAAEGFHFRFRRHPSLRFGRWLRVDFRVKLQGDFRGFSPELETDSGMFEFHRRRVGVQGNFLRHFEYEVERELRGANVWRDVFVNFRYLRDFQIQAGKFKLPFSLEELTSPTNLDFIYRSRIANRLSPARDLGIMAHGRFFKRGLSYQAGLFKNDGENSDFTIVVEEPGVEKQHIRSGLRTFAGRLTGKPLRLIPLPKVIKEVEFGGAFTSSTVPEGPKGLRGRTYSDQTFFPTHGQRMFIHGERRRLGAEMAWMPGPFSIKSEFIHVQEERRGQGIRGEDLPNLISRGWYLSGTWAVTGEKKAEGLAKPRKDFFTERGIGAVELAARYEALRFGSSEHPGRPTRSARGANVLGNSDRAWTFGVNWYLNRWGKIQANAIRENIEDVQRSPISGRSLFWTRLVRLQLIM